MSEGRPAIFISGAARGIGLACAERFAAGGYFVGLYDVAGALLERSAASLRARHGDESCCHLRVDLREDEAPRAALEHFAGHSGGRLDVLLNNAAVMDVGTFESVELAAHRRALAINLGAVIALAHEGFPLLSATPGARLINLSSIAALHGIPEMACYSATKHAVRGLSEALDLEWGARGIRVCDVMPGFVATQLLTDTQTLTAAQFVGVGLRAEDVAARVWQAAHARRHRVHWPVGWHSTLGYHLGRRLPLAWQRRILAALTKLPGRRA